MEFYNWLLKNKKLSYNTTKIYWYWVKSLGKTGFEQTYSELPSNSKKGLFSLLSNIITNI